MSYVLLIDFDEVFADAARHSLERVGLVVVAAATAAEARERLKAGAPLALVVRDALPDGEGGALLTALRAQPALRHVPALFVHSAVPDGAAVAQLTQGAGVVRHLVHPVPALRLRRALAAVPGVVEASRQVPAEHAELDLATTMELFDEFLGIAARHVQAMRDALLRLDGPGHADALQTLREQGHRFKGSGAAYGLPEVTRLGSEVEKLAAAPTASAPELAAAVEALAVRLRQVGDEASLPATP